MSKSKENNRLVNIRNIGIIAHIDAGKTTTTERVLYHAGVIHKVGEVHKKNTVTDFDPQERERGITIFSAAVAVKWKDYQINIIDTPGHIDFTAEVQRCLRVLDGGIVVIDGQAGVESQTETVWRQANEYQVPRLIFVNKMDKTGADFFYSVKTIEKRLHASSLVCQLPIGAENDLKGVIDLIELKACYFTLGDKEENYQLEKIPNSLVEKAKEYRHKLVEKVIEYDENLAHKYLEGKELTSQEIKSLIRKATLKNHFPVFCGSAFKNVGVKLLLDGVVDYLPSPLDKEEIKAFSPNDEVVKISPNYPHLMALAFKIVADRYAGKLTFLRVYSGELKVKSDVYNVTKGKKETIGRLVRIHANKREEIEKIEAGDIAAALGLEYTSTGDTLGEKANHLLMEKINFAKPVIFLAIEPKNIRDKDELGEALKVLGEEDPTFHYRYNPETRQMIISGMGELHLEISIERLKREFKLEVSIGKPEVAYRETIKNLVEIDYTHKKQTGGAGQFARVSIRFEPNASKGFEFVDAIREGKIPKQFIEPVKEGLIQAFSSGILLGYPIVDVKTTLYNGAFHEVDSSPLAFSTAGTDCFRENKEKFQSALLEPYMRVEVKVPSEYYGDVLANLTSRRGEIGKTNEETGIYILQLEIPLAEMLGYSTSLRSLTQGRGTFSMELIDYREVPPHLTEKLLKKEK